VVDRLEGDDLNHHNASTLRRAVDQAYAGAVAEVFNRMVKDLDHAQLQAARSDMIGRLDKVRTVHAEMRQRVEDIEA